MRFIISGTNELADEITSMAGKRGVICSSFSAFLKDKVTFAMCPDVVAIHVGDGEELPELVDTCRQKGWSLIHNSNETCGADLPDTRGIERYSVISRAQASRFFDLAEVLLN